jgi:LysM repeat protein
MIILAVLVNAGLLAIIFLLAINTDDDKISDSFEMTPSVVALKGNEIEYNDTPNSAVLERPRDELDTALREFADSSAFQPVMEEELYPYAVLDQEDLQNADSIQEVEVTPESPKNLKYVEVTVKKGDVLEKIARANGTTVSAIKDANQLKNERLNIGQVLRVPVSATKKTETVVTKTTPSAPALPEKKTPSKIASSGDPQYYTIKNGDNPWKIAKQFGVKVDDLLKLNGWNEEKARNLKVGDKIRIS